MTEQEAREAMVTREEAQREIALHGIEWAEFTNECGEHAEYSGATVINWLGY